MVVSADRSWGSVGGGNLEETALARARAMLAEGADVPEQLVLGLTDKARTDHGRQCCGGEVTLVLEPLPVVGSVAIFGVGHVGLQLARILAAHDLDLHLVDSRPGLLGDDRLALPPDGEARVRVHHSPVPELALGAVPAGTHVLVMTHDHAEDFALCDAALRCTHLGSVGLIGSAAKWARFRAGLAVEGHDEATIGRIRCPIGLPGAASSSSKVPAAIAVSVAAELMDLLAADRAGVGR
jgi:xanthine dehydrogenase accessory factor